MALTDNLVAYYKFDESSGNLADSTGNYAGTNTNVTFSAGKINNGGVFNGSDAEINCGRITQLESAGAFSISAWIKQTTLDQSKAIFVRGTNGGTDGPALYSYTNGNLYAEYTDGTNRGYFDYSTVISAGTWAHVVMVFNGSGSGNSGRLKLYVNGSEVTLTYSGTIGTTTGSGTDNFFIGGNEVTSYNWLGMIDEFGIWSRALSSTEVTSLYNSGDGLSYPFGSTPAGNTSNFFQLF